MSRFARRLVLKFPRRLVDRPVISEMVRTHDLEFNILKAQVTPRAEGLLVLELAGEKENFDAAMVFLRETGVSVQPLAADLRRDEDRCLQCGACSGLCPTGALVRDPVTQAVSFEPEECVACELCMRACPAGAMHLDF
ncbi:MAG: NIL domain-containing protein [Planctomycetota bacterium]